MTAAPSGDLDELFLRLRQTDVAVEAAFQRAVETGYKMAASGERTAAIAAGMAFAKLIAELELIADTDLPEYVRLRIKVLVGEEIVERVERDRLRALN